MSRVEAKIIAYAAKLVCAGYDVEIAIRLATQLATYDVLMAALSIRSVCMAHPDAHPESVLRGANHVLDLFRLTYLNGNVTRWMSTMRQLRALAQSW